MFSANLQDCQMQNSKMLELELKLALFHSPNLRNKCDKMIVLIFISLFYNLRYITIQDDTSLLDNFE